MLKPKLVQIRVLRSKFRRTQTKIEQETSVFLEIIKPVVFPLSLQSGNLV